ncbi:MAG TPA: hypothetical protein VKR06_18405 [Ktedonosporobacter sp.]|nr:hypothetical protein [Ktedonosporobacter sp.]
MHACSRSKARALVSLLTLTLVLSSFIAMTFVGSSTVASAAPHADGTLLKLNFLGTGSLGTKSTIRPNSATSTANEVSSAEDPAQVDDPQVAVNTPVPPPLPPPPANTPPPNPTPQNIATNNPGFTGFNGLSHFDQRNAGTGQYTNTQFSLEPPDQGLCVSGQFVLDAVNTALTVRQPNGTILKGPTPINQFFGLKPEVVRSTPPVFGDFTSDPKCYFDHDTQRWFFTVLQADVNPATGAFTGPTHVLIAVSQSADPTGNFGLFAINTTNDGTNGTPKRPNCPCLGDQPLIGADANGFYVTTNEFPQFTSGFNGALMYAISKRALVASAQGNVTLFPAVVLIDASQRLVPFGGLSYSIQPSTQPLGSLLGRENNGTEYFLSALDFTRTVDNRIATWALTNTRSLDQAVPNLTLSLTVINSQLYGHPVDITQKDGPRPEGNGAPAGVLRANDDRMNQVVFAAGLLWSGVNTIVQKPGEAARTGIAFFGVLPFFDRSGLHAITLKQGYISVAGNSVVFPSIGVNAFGLGVASFTLAGPDHFPSAAYMPISLFSNGDVRASVFRSGDVHIASAGAAPEDGFTCYLPGGRCRWGDYSAAVAAPDGSIWLASEYIPSTPRTVLANWGTFISRVDTF